MVVPTVQSVNSDQAIGTSAARVESLPHKGHAKNSSRSFGTASFSPRLFGKPCFKWVCTYSLLIFHLFVHFPISVEPVAQFSLPGSQLCRRRPWIPFQFAGERRKAHRLKPPYAHGLGRRIKFISRQYTSRAKIPSVYHYSTSLQEVAV